MLLVVTPNPAIDRTLHVPQLRGGELARAASVHLAAGGKGMNLCRVARMLGVDVTATGPLAGYTGQIVRDLARAEGIAADWFWLESGQTRTCLLVNHDDRDSTIINEIGPVVSAGEWRGLAAHLHRLAERAQAVAFAGSVPPGVSPAELAALARRLAAAGHPVYLDTSGDTLAAALARPDGLSIKINRDELAEGLGVELDNRRQVVEAGQMLVSRGAALVVVTLGGRGALAVAAEGCWYAAAPQVKVVSTVGSGDALLAGLLAARLEGQSLAGALAWGVACGAANAATPLAGRFEPTAARTLLRQVRCEPASLTPGPA